MKYMIIERDLVSLSNSWLALAHYQLEELQFYEQIVAPKGNTLIRYYYMLAFAIFNIKTIFFSILKLMYQASLHTNSSVSMFN